MSRAGFALAAREDAPEEQRRALRLAVRWQVFTIGYTAATITLVAFVLGNSQAMKTAWIEDVLSLIPQLAFLTALLVIRRGTNLTHPYGWHRAMGVGHLVAGVALLAIGANLAIEAVVGLLGAERPTIGTVALFGETVWLGWLMIGAMVLVVVGPFVYGPAKARLAPVLHNKLLYADADMAKADWQTNAASVVGVLGVGLGVWWLDGAAALFISLGIIWDGLRNTGAAVQDLMDQRARRTDGKAPHPLAQQLVDRARAEEWVAEAGVRMRDQGQVFHVEVFVRPREASVPLDRIGALGEALRGIDWKLADLVVVPTDPIPDYADRGRDGGSAEAEATTRRPHRSQPR